MASAKGKSIPFFPILLTLTAAGALAALAVRFYRRPWETTRGVIRAGMLLAGIRAETCNLGGSAMHYYCAGRRGMPVLLFHCLGTPRGPCAARLRFFTTDY